MPSTVARMLVSYSAKRRAMILDWLREHGATSIHELAFSIGELAGRIVVIVRDDLDSHDGNLSARPVDVRAWRRGSR